MSWVELTARILVSFVVLLIMTRIMGKKQLSQLTFFNYVTGITIGSIAASLTIDNRLPISQGVYSLMAWAFLTILMGYISLKSAHARLLIDGQPTILIKHGKIIEATLVKTGINMDDLTMLLRKANAFDIKEVDYAILEPDGQLSVLKKAEYQNVTRKDMFIPVPATKNMPAEIIVNGKVVEKNLEELNIDRLWLDSEISKQGYQKIDDIFYAELGSDGGLYVLPVHDGQDRLFH